MSPGRLLALALAATLTACSGSNNPEDPADAGSDGGTPSSNGPLLPSSPLGETTVGAPFERSLAASGGALPLTYSAQGLPAGLALGARSGVLSGAPAAVGLFDFDISVTDDAGRADQRRYSLLVIEAPYFLTSDLPPASLSVPYSARIEATGGKAPLTYRTSAGALPPGLVLEPSGALSGTPASVGPSVFEVSVTDTHGSVRRAPFALEVRHSRPSFLSAELPPAFVSHPYRFTVMASGGTPPYTWRTTAGELPAGIALSTSGELAGTASSAGTASLTLEVRDAQGISAQRAFSLTVIPSLALTTTALPDAYRGRPYPAALEASGGVPPYSFTLVTGSLPEGVHLGSDGRFSGTPSASDAFGITLNVQDASQQSVSRALSLTVREPPGFASSTLRDGLAGSAYSDTLQPTGGKAPYSFRVLSGSLPAGLLLSGDAISGTPTTSGTASFIVEVRDANDQPGTQVFTLRIADPLAITTTSLPEATLGTPYTVVLGYTGGRGTLFWGYFGTLPPGLFFGSDGSVRGTPTASGTWSFTATLEDSFGGMDSRVFPLTVRASAPDGGSPDGGSPDAGSPDAGSLFVVGHWNIEWFGSDTQGPPRSTSPGGPLDDLQIANARSVLLDAGVNLWGLVEMVDATDFATLKAQLPGYDGFLSNDPRVDLGPNYYSPGEQKVGVLYDNRLSFLDAGLILTSASTDFAGRPPMRVDFSTRIHGTASPLVVIVLHMKAFDDGDSYARRQRASAALKSYLDAVLPSHRVLVIGDWNDDVDVSITRDGGVPVASPFENFVNDPDDYAFVTRPLSLAGERSTVDFPEMIDHTLVTNEVLADYVTGSARVLRPGWIADYAGTTSDHYPVLSTYDFGPPPAAPLLPSGFIPEALPEAPSGAF
jgi:hypothetical protein